MEFLYYSHFLKILESDTSDNKSLIGKKVTLKNMSRKDLGILDGSNGKIIKSFKEGERESEGDLPRREGDPEIFKIKLDKPKDPMYPDINLSREYFSLKNV